MASVKSLQQLVLDSMSLETKRQAIHTIKQPVLQQILEEQTFIHLSPAEQQEFLQKNPDFFFLVSYEAVVVWANECTTNTHSVNVIRRALINICRADGVPENCDILWNDPQRRWWSILKIINRRDREIDDLHSSARVRIILLMGTLCLIWLLATLEWWQPEESMFLEMISSFVLGSIFFSSYSRFRHQ